MMKKQVYHSGYFGSIRHMKPATSKPSRIHVLFMPQLKSALDFVKNWCAFSMTHMKEWQASLLMHNVSFMPQLKSMQDLFNKLIHFHACDWCMPTHDTYKGITCKTSCASTCSGQLLKSQHLTHVHAFKACTTMHYYYIEQVSIERSRI